MNRRLWENLCSLYGMHILNYVVPVLTLPFLARTLGPVEWAALAFAEAAAGYISLFVEYGFGLSATRYLAKHREDQTVRSRFVSSVVGAQLFLILVAGLGTLLAWTCAPMADAYRRLLPIALLLSTLRSLNPLWYFQGVERMRIIGVVTVSTNLVAAVGQFSFIHTPGDAWISLGLRTVAALVSTVAAFIILMRETPLIRPALKDTMQALREGWSLFLFKSAVSLYTTANVLLLGVLAAPTAVAWFAGAERLIKAATGALTPITQTFYPRITALLATNREDANRVARFSAMLTVGFGVAAGSFLFLFAPWLVRLTLGAGFLPSVPVLKLLSLLPPLIAASNVLGVQWMLPLGLDKEFNYIIAGAGVINLILSFLWAPGGKQMGMAGSVVVAETFVTLAIILVLRHRRLQPWQSQPVPAFEIAEEAA